MALWGGGGVRQGEAGQGGSEGKGGGVDLYGVKGDTRYARLAVIHRG